MAVEDSWYVYLFITELEKEYTFRGENSVQISFASFLLNI